jgi:anti-sigma B factor antagonist
MPMGTPTWVVERVSGDIDLAAAPALRSRLQDAINAGNAFIVLDLSELLFIDSTGLGVVVGAHRRAGEVGGEVRIAAAAPRVMRVLSVTGLDRVFRTFASVDDAIAAPFTEATTT